MTTQEKVQTSLSPSVGEGTVYRDEDGDLVRITTVFGYIEDGSVKVEAKVQFLTEDGWKSLANISMTDLMMDLFVWKTKTYEHAETLKNTEPTS